MRVRIPKTDSGLVLKARLVARGFEEPENDVRKESPTCSKYCLRVIMAIIAQKKWSLNTVDIKTAFLQGATIERDTYLRPPREAKTGNLWKLRKCAYGLADASHKWCDQVKDFMLSVGCKMSLVDPAVFYYYQDGSLQGIIAVYVDVLFWAGLIIFKCIVSLKCKVIFRVRLLRGRREIMVHVFMRKLFVVASFTNLTYYCCVCVTKWHASLS